MSYYNVTLNEMREVLRSEKGWKLLTKNKSKEYIFDFPLTSSPHIVIRVCSGIVFNGFSRDRGKDAIRVFAIDTKMNKGFIKSKSVYRIETWEKNLRKAVMNCFEQAKIRKERENNF